MAWSGKKATTCIGFLAVVTPPSGELLGGYLILNVDARPLEFHCTAPVKPSRAQEILYGPTLYPYLCGEIIAPTLLDRSKLMPAFVCCSEETLLAARPAVELPIAWLPAAAEKTPSKPDNERASSPRPDDHPPAATEPAAFSLAGLMWMPAPRYGDDRRTIEQHVAGQLDGFDFIEPFARIREAIREAGSGARAA